MMTLELPQEKSFKAIVDGMEFTKIPEDLFIPPDALEILLESFSGPLDLLLYLIRKQNIDILNIPMVSITNQYLHYIQLMQYRKLELAADYLLMAATLAEIKSRMLLPVLPVFNEEEDENQDPRMALVRRLQAYEQIKEAAQLLDALPRKDRDFFLTNIISAEVTCIKTYPDVVFSELIDAMKSLLQREDHKAHHQISKEAISVREKMSAILFLLQQHKKLEFRQLFHIAEGRSVLVVTFLAVLELGKQSLLLITQNHAFSPIYVQAV